MQLCQFAIFLEPINDLYTKHNTLALYRIETETVMDRKLWLKDIAW